MHNKKFFISWYDDQNKFWSEDVTGLRGIITQLWQIYDNYHFKFNSIRISVIPDNHLNL